MDTNAETTGAWHADPTTPGQLRWWDGAAWTEHVAPDPSATPSPPLRVAGAQPSSTEQSAPLHAANESATPIEPSSGRPSVRGLLMLVAVVVLVVFAGGWVLVTLSDDATVVTPTPAPATPPADPASNAPGSAVPTAIDDATGNGVSKAQDTAALLQQQNEAMEAASQDPSTQG